MNLQNVENKKPTKLKIDFFFQESFFDKKKIDWNLHDFR